MNTISSDDARLLMSKWKNEGSRLHVVFTEGGEGMEFPSCVFDVQPDFLILARYSSAGFWIWLREATFKYAEPREAPERIRARSESKFEGCLEVSWPAGGKCLLYELRLVDRTGEA